MKAIKSDLTTVSNIGVLHESTIPETEVVSVMALMSSLYPSNPRAILRELVSNGVDSHARAGQTRPVEIQLPCAENPNLIVSDYGTGMDYETIAEVYGNFGRSTKREDNSQIGQKGAGAKSPYAITDQFTVVSRHEGTAYHLLFTKTAAGAPAWTLMGQVDTDEPNGVIVSVPVRNEMHEDFHKAVNHTLPFFRDKITFTGHSEGFELLDVNSLIRTDSRIGDVYLMNDPMGRLCIDGAHIDNLVVMGGVMYRLPDSLKRRLWADTPNTFGHHRHFEPYNDDSRAGTKYVFEVPIGTFSPAPDREHLADTEYNIETLREIKNRWYNRILDEVIRPLEDLDYAAFYKAYRAIDPVIRYAFHQQISKTVPKIKNYPHLVFTNALHWHSCSKVRNRNDANAFQMSIRHLMGDDYQGKPVLHEAGIDPKADKLIGTWRSSNDLPEVISIDFGHDETLIEYCGNTYGTCEDLGIGSREDFMRVIGLSEDDVRWVTNEELLASKKVKSAEEKAKRHRLYANFDTGSGFWHRRDPMNDETLAELIENTKTLDEPITAVIGAHSDFVDAGIALESSGPYLTLKTRRKNPRAFLDEFGGQHLDIITPAEMADRIRNSIFDRIRNMHPEAFAIFAHADGVRTYEEYDERWGYNGFRKARRAFRSFLELDYSLRIQIENFNDDARDKAKIDEFEAETLSIRNVLTEFHHMEKHELGEFIAAAKASGIDFDDQPKITILSKYPLTLEFLSMLGHGDQPSNDMIIALLDRDLDNHARARKPAA